MNRFQEKNPFDTAALYQNRKKKALDWEESAVDSVSPVKEGLFDADRLNPALRGLFFLLIVVFALLFSKIFYLQIIQGRQFRLISENNRIRRQVILAPRGNILDRNGEKLAQNIASFNLVAVPLDLFKESLEGQVIKLGEQFKIDVPAVLAKLKAADPKSLQPILIKQDLTQEEGILFETKASEFVGFSLQKIPIRQYSDPLAFSHVLGYTGIISQDDLKIVDSSLYDANDYIGKTGIELEYEKYLHGLNGENMVEVDASGRLLNVLGELASQSGNTLILNIDAGLQKKLYEDLAGSGKTTKKAAAIALNPKNGQVLALISLPGFDNNLFAHGIKPEDYKKLISDPSLPIFNRAISGTYPPGSTIKPLIASAALQENIVDENRIIIDKGLLVIPNQFNPQIAYNFYGWKREGLGPMNIKTAIAMSSDIYFYTVAGGYPGSQIAGLGAEKLAEYYKKFNLGQDTGIDLQGEKPGLVADPNWKAEYFKDDPILSKWYLGDTYHIGIGQGDMLATPLQVAFWTATVANSGTGFKPEILEKVIDENGKIVFQSQPQIVVNKFISDKNIKIVQEGMRQAVLSGTARQLNTLPISSAGKTGTSQFDGSDPKRTHAWFTAYAPFEDPQIVITVLIEAGGEGNAVALPVVKDALNWWAENRYKK